MISNWEEKRLEEVLDYEQPTNYLVETDDYDDDFDIPVLTAGKTFLLGYTNEKKGIFNKVPVIIFDDFTTAFHYVDFPFKVKSSAIKILKCDKNKNDLKFLYYQMKTLKIDTQLHKRYWISRFSKLDFRCPPLETQQRIAEILDNAAALRDKTAQLLEEYDALAQSLFLDMFGDPVTNTKGWEEVNFKEVLVLKRGYDLPVQNRIIGEYPIMASNGFLDWHNSYKVKGPGIVTGRSGTLGKVCYIENDYWPLNTVLYSQKMNGNNPIYLTFLLRNFKIERFSRGAGVPTLNRNLVHNESIIKTPIHIQNEFAEKIALIEKQKELAKQELQESEDLFNALLQKAFKGELVS